MTGGSASLVVLTYNQENFVCEAVRGALEQAGEPIDILISDDCSQDSTYGIITELVAQYQGNHTVRINKNPQNIGLVAHINQVVNMTNGELIVPAYGDDISKPNRVARLVQTYRQTNALLVHSLADPIDASGKSTESNYRNALFYHSTDPLQAATSMALYLGAAGAWSRELFDTYGPLDDSRVYDDHILGFRAALEGRVSFIEESLLFYREGVGISHALARQASPDERVSRRIKVLEQYEAVFRQRLKDARIFGLSDSDSIIKKLKQALSNTLARKSFYDGFTGMWSGAHKEPLTRVAALTAEALRAAKGR